MKIQHLLLTLIATAAIVLTGCNKNSTVSVDTAKLTTAFQSAETDAKTAVDAITTSVKNADYAGAMTQLKALGDKYKLTPEQQQAVSDVLAQVQKAIDAMAGKAAEDAGKAATDLGNAIKK